MNFCSLSRSGTSGFSTFICGILVGGAFLLGGCAPQPVAPDLEQEPVYGTLEPMEVIPPTPLPAATVAPEPQPTPQAELPPYSSLAQGNPASTPGENGVDAPDRRPARGGPPKNEGPMGRVTQVEQYIRENAAIPQSLHVKAWGPVQPHGNGYKVRVQYSLESADGFGLSNEDMMFFMYPSGRVYRKAAVR